MSEYKITVVFESGAKRSFTLVAHCGRAATASAATHVLNRQLSGEFERGRVRISPPKRLEGVTVH